MMFAMSFQAMAQNLRELILRVGPALALTGLLLATWAIARFITKYHEQQRILRYLPDVIRQELERRDAELKTLRARLAELEELRTAREVALKAAYTMAGKVQEIVVAAGLTANGTKRLAGPKP